jgi:ATP-binding cassette subfamily C (CFTR/MRP) protein 1
MLRGSLITAVFEKATELSLADSSSAKSVTLMSTDVERTIRGLLDMHDMWANVIQVAIAAWLIETELGVACVAPILIAIGMFTRLVDRIVH